jgi:hypothetical protein
MFITCPHHAFGPITENYLNPVQLDKRVGEFISGHDHFADLYPAPSPSVSVPTPTPTEQVEFEDACPHCSPTHERPESRPWGVYVSPDRLDGQPTHLVVQPSNGAHVAQSDADWLWQLIRDYRPEGPSV